jgi:hypothetical protein
MDENTKEPAQTPDLPSVVRTVIQEFMDAQRVKSEPAFKAELMEERRRREQLETRMNQLAEEAKRQRERAEEMDRNSFIRAELHKLGVTKIDLAFKAVKDDLVRNEEGTLVAKGPEGEISAKEFLITFVSENPELLPARMSGGSGTAREPRNSTTGFDLDRIKPGMEPEEMDRVRKEIARLAQQSLRG